MNNNKLQTLNFEYQELSDKELETVTGGTIKSCSTPPSCSPHQSCGGSSTQP